MEDHSVGTTSEFQAIPPRLGRLDITDTDVQDLFFLDRGQRFRGGTIEKQDKWRNGGGKRALLSWPLKGSKGSVLERRARKVMQANKGAFEMLKDKHDKALKYHAYRFNMDGTGQNLYDMVTHINPTEFLVETPEGTGKTARNGFLVPKQCLSSLRHCLSLQSWKAQSPSGPLNRTLPRFRAARQIVFWLPRGIRRFRRRQGFRRTSPTTRTRNKTACREPPCRK